ncbi:hypothetical protein M440DRAFT_78266 [Trichoderma longibrachiatum ATCC 18648]|uniref:Secreted protein n=1 Tax=Trichoderma longibrachiatum ATCC 18648 TaxID=983965 RepID=A0A2T4CI16_TRILO|nr:hypothetical protein M440DRAFT_78266 [Trichoderma longibrachiatum ATCC 18648]
MHLFFGHRVFSLFWIFFLFFLPSHSSYKASFLITALERFPAPPFPRLGVENCWTYVRPPILPCT